MPNTPADTIDKIMGLLRDLKTQLSGPAARPAVAVAEPEPAPAEDLGSFEALKAALQSAKWPEAVNPHLICDPQSHDDKVERGRGIIELMVEENLAGLKFLDFGCGEGHCAFLSTDYGTEMSVGYDPASRDGWAAFGEKPNLLFTASFADVQARGPYNVIIVFDVIDHLTAGDPTAVLAQAASVLAPGGKIYMRTHPFVSRHGTHLYHDLNKAYVHLVFTPDEIRQLVPESKYAEPSVGVTTPIMTYMNCISGAGLAVVSKRDITEKVEPFFKIPKIAERITRNAKAATFPEFQMSMQFIDYVLTKA